MWVPNNLVHFSENLVRLTEPTKIIDGHCQYCWVQIISFDFTCRIDVIGFHEK